MQSSLVVWTPNKSSSAVDLVNEDLTSNENFVTSRLLMSSDEQGTLSVTHSNCTSNVGNDYTLSVITFLYQKLVT